MKRQVALTIASLLVALLAATGAFADTYPSKSIRFIVPYPPGGGTDVLARLLAEKMSLRLGQPIVIENKPGAAGILGTDAFAKSSPDGYTVLVSISSSMLANVYLYEKLPYDPRRDLTLVSLLATGPLVLVVHPSVPANTGPELVKYVAQNKGKLTYGSYGVGSYPHLAGSFMSESQKAGMSHIAYKGEAPMMQDLVGGQIHMAYSSVLQAKPFADAGRIKILGITGERRSSAIPDVPTLAEQGLDDEAYRVTGWLGMALPAGAPRAIVQRLADEVRAACDLPDIKARVAALGFEMRATTPEVFAATYKQDAPVWERLIKQSGAKVE